MSDRRRTEKVELPLARDAEIDLVVQSFEERTLPYENWTHRAHLAVAVSYIRKYPFDEALSRIRDKIGEYNRERGDPEGYNETVTIMFLRKIQSEMELGHSCGTMHEEVARLSRVCTIEWLYTYYSRAQIWSDAAKSRWVAPDLGDLDF